MRDVGISRIVGSYLHSRSGTVLSCVHVAIRV
jgi:hypothetical protein